MESQHSTGNPESTTETTENETLEFNSQDNQQISSHIFYSPDPDKEVSSVLRKTIKNPSKVSYKDILQLQSTIGNKAVMRLLNSKASKPVVPHTLTSRPNLIQRYWSVKAVEELKKQVKQRYVWPEGWGEGVLHHKISRSTFSKLAKELATAIQNKKDQDLSAAALGFWKAVQEAAGDTIKAQANNGYEKTLWNIPLNLELGPSYVRGDPGTELDPNTEEYDDGSRELDDVSGHLKIIDDTFNLNQGALQKEHWETMRKAMLAAFEAQGSHTGLATPLWEQWEKDSEQDGKVKFVRKGLRTFPGAKEGKEKFERDRAIVENIANLNGSVNPATPLVQQNFGGGVALRISFPENSLYHMCQRHTYRHFTFNATDIKSVNNFWPEGTGVATLRGKLGVIANGILTNSIQKLEEEKISIENIDSMEDIEFEAGNRTIGGEKLYFIVHLEMDFDQNNHDTPYVKGTVKTVAPDVNVEAYSGEELRNIKNLLGL